MCRVVARTTMAEERSFAANEMIISNGSIVIVGKRLLQSNENFTVRYKLNSHTADWRTHTTAPLQPFDFMAAYTGKSAGGKIRLVKSRKVEAIEVHHLVPCRHEVMHERLLRIAAGIDFRERTELGVRAEHEIDDGSCPFQLTRRPIVPLQYAFVGG